MKTKLIWVLVLLILTSCSGVGHGNFNKQKYTNLKSKKPRVTGSLSSDLENSSQEQTSSQNEQTDQSDQSETEVQEEKLSTDYSTIIEDELNSFIEQKQDLQEIEDVERKFTNDRLRGAHERIHRKKTDHSEGTSAFWFLSLFALMPGLFLFRKSTYKYSLWARDNGRKSRWWYGFLSTIGVTGSIALGELTRFGISDHSWLLIGGLGLASVGLYTKKKSNWKFNRNRAALFTLHTVIFYNAFEIGCRGTFFNHDPGDFVLHPFIQILLVILLLAAIAGALYGTAIMACSISCSGYDILAVIFFGAGLGTAILGGIVGFYSIFRKEGKERSQDMTNTMWALLVVTIITLALLVAALLII